MVVKAIVKQIQTAAQKLGIIKTPTVTVTELEPVGKEPVKVIDVTTTPPGKVGPDITGGIKIVGSGGGSRITEVTGGVTSQQATQLTGLPYQPPITQPTITDPFSPKLTPTVTLPPEKIPEPKLSTIAAATKRSEAELAAIKREQPSLWFKIKEEYKKFTEEKTRIAETGRTILKVGKPIGDVFIGLVGTGTGFIFPEAAKEEIIPTEAEFLKPPIAYTPGAPPGQFQNIFEKPPEDLTAGERKAVRDFKERTRAGNEVLFRVSNTTGKSVV